MGAWTTAWKHIRRSPYQAFAAILVMMQTFFIISIFTIIIGASTSIIEYFESLPQVSAFFKDEAKQEEIAALEKELKATGKVSEIKFISKDEALKIYQKEFQEDELLLDLVTAEILPASFDISTHDIQDLSEIAELLDKSSIVNDISFPKEIVENLASVTDALKKIGLALIIIFAITSTFVMAMMVSIKVSQKKEEIEIMKLLSATNWYVRWPFMLEGMFYGVMGALLGWLTSVLGVVYLGPQVKSLTIFREIPLMPESPQFLLGMLGTELFVAIILGCFASYLAVLRYLK